MSLLKKRSIAVHVSGYSVDFNGANNTVKMLINFFFENSMDDYCGFHHAVLEIEVSDVGHVTMAKSYHAGFNTEKFKAPGLLWKNVYYGEDRVNEADIINAIADYVRRNTNPRVEKFGCIDNDFQVLNATIKLRDTFKTEEDKRYA